MKAWIKPKLQRHWKSVHVVSDFRVCKVWVWMAECGQGKRGHYSEGNISYRIYRHLDEFISSYITFHCVFHIFQTLFNMREISEKSISDLPRIITGKLLIYVFQQQHIKVLKKGFWIFSHFQSAELSGLLSCMWKFNQNADKDGNLTAVKVMPRL